MATETNVEQYIDIDGLRQLLNLIKQTYVCQKGLTSKIREQVYDILESLGSSVVVKQTFNDNRTDPTEIATSDFPDYAWKNSDLLCVENSDEHMSVFYWNNAKWICISKAPVNNIDLNDTEENLKKIIPTASAVVKIVDKKLESLGSFTPGTGNGNINIGIATESKAGIVKASDEISVDPTSGLMTIRSVSVGKIASLDDKIKEIAYTKEEINRLLLASSAASDLATLNVVNVNNLYSPENIGKEIGTVANITSSDGTVLESYILETKETGEKVWIKLDNHEASISDKLTELEEKADSSGTWDTF